MPGDPMALKQRYGSPAWLLFLSGYYASVSSQKREKKIRLGMQGGGHFQQASWSNYAKVALSDVGF